MLDALFYIGQALGSAEHSAVVRRPLRKRPLTAAFLITLGWVSHGASEHCNRAIDFVFRVVEVRAEPQILSPGSIVAK